MKIVAPAETEETADKSPDASSAALSANPEILATLRERLDFVYPHQAATALPTKVSATALKDYDDGSGEEASALIWEMPEFEFRRPKLDSEKSVRLSATAFGTATHSFLQYVDLQKCSCLEDLEEEVLRLESMCLLTEDEAKAIDCAALLRFFQSPTGALLKKGKVHREFRFTLLSDASECFGEEVLGEEILLQGIIDCLVEEDDSLSIIDYKTDRVNPQQAEERAKLYQSQLWAYARSAERIFQKKVKTVLIHFLRPGVSIEV